MKHTAKLLLVCLPLLAVMLGACSSDSPLAPATESVVPGALKTGRPLAVESATLHVWALNTNDAPVNVHRITAPWDEATTTWVTFGSQYAPEIVNSFPADAIGWRTVDITSLVSAWANGDQPNYGLLLDQPQDGTPWVKYHSRENATNQPWLEVCFLMDDGEVVCEALACIADTYVWENRPNVVHGLDLVLYTGWTAPSPYEKQSLLLFGIPEIPDEPGDGCTLTPGYWKTHSEFGPAPYDATWAELPQGASTPFFLSGKTYHQVLWTPPAGGNAYYILAHAYIAAKLNKLNGADFTDAQAAFDAATTVFDTYTPAQIGALRGAARNPIVALAQTLDDYNNGLIGPGHCSD